MKPRFLSRLRLMPVVIVVGTGLFAMKTSGLVLEAQAAEAIKPTASAASAIDLAGPEDMNASPNEVDILTTLGKRRDEMDGRSRDLDMRANLLAATEKRVDDKIAQLKELQALMTKLLNQRDAEQQKQVTALVKTYSAMKAQAAAGIFAVLDDEVLIPVAQEMKSDVLAPILSAMPPSAAQKLTVKLANRLTLPKTAPVPPPALAPEASLLAPETQTEAVPPVTPEAPPLQKQAALTPAPQAEAKPVAAKPVQVAAKPAATAPVAKAPEAVKPAAPTAAKTAEAAKPEVKADAKPDAKAEAPVQAAPTAPAAPPGAAIH